MRDLRDSFHLHGPAAAGLRVSPFHPGNPVAQPCARVCLPRGRPTTSSSSTRTSPNPPPARRAAPVPALSYPSLWAALAPASPPPGSSGVLVVRVAASLAATKVSFSLLHLLADLAGRGPRWAAAGGAWPARGHCDAATAFGLEGANEVPSTPQVSRPARTSPSDNGLAVVSRLGNLDAYSNKCGGK